MAEQQGVATTTSTEDTAADAVAVATAG